ncbi:hypothetical protein [Heyndrickxia acidicola]|uniref:Glycogen debranching protein n=1 Tax=Heyndrickxia acidicola TaxID=209389 RepID=A0ABU6MN86_9BACI|nr:hypothetical protein [Heyndrickxia acidicola]MED1204662.1 glycogen debranching protein [Heyndrickxia acidicola]
MLKITDLIEEIKNPDERSFLTPGTRMHLIGAQNGGFPAFGHHIENEMGGIWMHPIKILDGFWMGLKVDGRQFEWLKQASIFRNHPFYNEHIYQAHELVITRFQLAPQETPGLIVRYILENKEDYPVLIEGDFVVRSDLRPVWYSETENIIPGKDEAWIDNDCVVVKDSDHNWFARVYAHCPHAIIEIDEQIEGYEQTYGEGVGAKWNFRTTVEPGESYVFTVHIAGSIKSEKETYETINNMKNVEKHFEHKKKHYQGILDRAAIDIPDEELAKQYAWVKCHMEWLTIDVPSVGRGLAAGIPEYPWWFGCDSAYSLAGCVPAGFHKLAEDTLDVVAEASLRKNGNGRIVHEINTFGIVGNPGNTQETSHFIRAVYDTYKWTGNREWLRSHFDEIKNGLRWLLEEMDTDKDLFPEGYGIMEILGLNGELIDTAVYTAVALENAAEMAELFGEEIQARKYKDLGEQLTKKITEEMWLEKEGLYADIRIPGKDLYPRLDDFIHQARLGNDLHLIPYYEGMKEELITNGMAESEDDTAWCFKNWVINTPLEMGLSETGSALQALKRLNGKEFTGEYGMYLSGLEQNRMMTISTAVQVNANLRYHQTDAAYQQIQNVMKTFGMYLPGSISEMSPDYGCFVQAWTSYALLSPIICGFIGIRPNAAVKEVTFEPQLPTNWERARVQKLMIGTNELDVLVERDIKSENGYSVIVHSKETGWTFHGATETCLIN